MHVSKTFEEDGRGRGEKADIKHVPSAPRPPGSAEVGQNTHPLAQRRENRLVLTVPGEAIAREDDARRVL